MNVLILKKPSAFIPIVMSLVALAIVGAQVAVFGVTRQADEGAAAHLWQLLMGLQIPIVAFFAVKWLSRMPRQAFLVLALQICAILAACVPVFLLHL